MANHHIQVEIPDDLSEVIQRGIDQGKKIKVRRRRVQRALLRSACSLVLVTGLFAGAVTLSPALAAAMEDVPILGRLVQIFGKNQAVVEGGVSAADGAATVTMERSGDTELMYIDFAQEDAARYKAEFASCPKTITITLPGTVSVYVRSEITRAQDTSQYIKSVYEVPVGTPETTVLQLELENDADVQIEEYRDPGRLAIRLLPTEIQLETVYSVRTLSYTGDQLQAALGQYAGQSTRILQDDKGHFFVELAQYKSRDAAMAAASDGLIVEARTGNEVPVCFVTMEEYQSGQLLDEYYQRLITSSTAKPVLDFLEEHLSSASPAEQDAMLRGLYGFLQDTDEALDWAQIASFYQTANQEVPEYVQQHLKTQNVMRP